MIVSFLVICVGFVLLVRGAGYFVHGAASLAHYLKISPILIGMIVLGFGTSVPEMIISGMSSFQGNPHIALGNAYGSNIANIALVMGCTAIITPVLVHLDALKRELPVLLTMTAIAAFQLRDGKVTRIEAIFLLVLFVVVLLWFFKVGKREEITMDMFHEKGKLLAFKNSLMHVLVGLIVLVGSSRVLVWGATDIAHRLGVSDLVIGLTIFAVGTSLPELASTISAVRKMQYSLALGNILGSNLFNTLVVVGIAGTIHPMVVESTVLTRDLALAAFMTMLLLLFGIFGKGLKQISRIEGSLFLFIYVVYIIYLFLQ